jgi:hypothetical protein
VSPLPSAAVGAFRPSTTKIDVSMLSLLNYIRSTFDDESVLDSIPLEAAGNSSAWHAWRAHSKRPAQPSTASALSLDAKSKRRDPQPRPPGEWNWEGVWANRTQTAIQTSYLESVLFGSSARGAAATGGVGGGGEDLVGRPLGSISGTLIDPFCTDSLLEA